MRRSYRIEGRNLYECIQANKSYARIDAPKSLQHRYIYEDVPTGLVPLEAIGRAMGIPMTLTGSIINLADRILCEDFRRIGRNAEAPQLADAPFLRRAMADLGALGSP